MNSVYKFTVIGRSVDLSYPTNRVIVGLSVVVMVAGSILKLLMANSPMVAVGWGVSAGLSVFLAWVLGRELDPDHDWSAFVGAGLAIAGSFVATSPALSALFWLVLVLRMVNRTVGLPFKLFDSLTVLGLGGWLTVQGNWLYGAITALAFLLDSILNQPNKLHRYFALATGLLTAGIAVMGNAGGNQPLPGWFFIAAMVVISVLFLPVIVASEQIKTVGDATGLSLNGRRVQTAQGLALLSAWLLAVTQGEAGVLSLVSLWTVLLGVGLYRIIGLLGAK